MVRINNNTDFVTRMEIIKPDFDIIGEWSGSQTKINFRHRKCNTLFSATPNNMLKEDYGGCPECGKNYRKNSDYLKKLKGDIFKVESKLNELYKSNEYTLLDTEYINNKTPLLVRCNKCNYEFKISYVNICKSKGCKYCNQISKYNSKGVRKIKEFLNKLEISYELEIIFDECKRKKELPFDFIIYLDKDKLDYILLEYDGELHFRPYDNSPNSIKKFKEQVERDGIKDKFCKDYNIELIRINYKQLKDIEKIILDKIYNKYFMN